ncbi:hypothetical protein V8E52_005760 [Russula decolorans]
MEPQNRRELNFRVNASPAADAHSGWCATALPTLQHPQSAPSESSHHLPDPSQPHDYTGVVWDDRVPTVDAAGNRRQDEAREDMPPPVESTVALGQPQASRYDDMAYYDMAYDYPPPHGHRDHDVADYAGLAQDPTEAPVNQPAHDINTFDDAGQHAAAGPARAFVDEWPHQDLIPNGLAAEYLQRIAIHYMHQPNLQVSLIHMEPSHAGGVKVVITLEMADF